MIRTTVETASIDTATEVKLFSAGSPVRQRCGSSSRRRPPDIYASFESGTPTSARNSCSHSVALERSIAMERSLAGPVCCEIGLAMIRSAGSSLKSVINLSIWARDTTALALGNQACHALIAEAQTIVDQFRLNARPLIRRFRFAIDLLDTMAQRGGRCQHGALT